MLISLVSECCRLEESDSGLGNAKEVGKPESQNLGPSHVEKLKDLIGVGLIEGKSEVLVDVDSSIVEKGLEVVDPTIGEVTQPAVLASYRSGATTGKDKGSVVSFNSVDVSSHHIEADGADLNVVSSPRRRSWKRMARNQVVIESSNVVQLGKRAINFHADEERQGKKRVSAVAVLVGEIVAVAVAVVSAPVEAVPKFVVFTGDCSASPVPVVVVFAILAPTGASPVVTAPAGVGPVVTAITALVVVALIEPVPKFVVSDSVCPAGLAPTAADFAGPSFAVPTSVALALIALAVFTGSASAPAGAEPGLAAPTSASPVVAAIATSVVAVPVVADRAMLQGFFFTLGLPSPAYSAGPGSLKWLPPQLGHFKLNVDAALNSADECFGVGDVVRNDLGSLVVMKGYFFFRVWYWLIEARAVLEGLWLVAEFNLLPLVVECDSLTMVNLCAGVLVSRSDIDNLIY
ncbi:hypothetical protein ACOSP7_007603 [Xanthoceras sorbifolium]